MRTALWLGRLRPAPLPQIPPSSATYPRLCSSTITLPGSRYIICQLSRQHHGGKFLEHYKFQWRNYRFPPPPPPPRRPPDAYPRTTALLIAATLTPAAFLQLAENGIEDDTTTAESEMLAASREEALRVIPDDLHVIVRFCWNVYIFVDRYVAEPVATAMRLLHLIVIFVPVIATVPVIWIGGRVKSRDGERSGTLW
ncbi:hypothetical protein RJZ90_007631, partial [Blastomyces dermatitidis]